MAITCTLIGQGPDSIDVAIDTDVVLPDDVIVFAVTAVAVSDPIGAITPSVGWLTSVASGSSTQNAGNIFVGVVPDPVPSTVTFQADNASIFSAIGKVVRNVDPANPVSASDSFSDFTNAPSIDVSVGPLAVTTTASYVLYVVAAIDPDQTDFEDGPTPALPEIQFGRSTTTNPIVESGIWAQNPTSVGNTATYEQTIPAGDGDFIEAVAALIVLQPICLS